MRGRVYITAQREYKPGDLPPDGYLAWHEWAEVQRKAGIKQVPCCKCGLWKTPQELSDKPFKTKVKDGLGNPGFINSPICSKCAKLSAGEKE